MPRSAAKVTLSFEAHVKQLHRKVDDLERQLNEAKGHEDRASRLRVSLCEIMADLMMTDPASSAEKKIAGRLWHGCFYSRLGPIRQRVQKEQRRGTDAAPRVEEQFNTFLSESVTLYQYLITEFSNKLMRKAGIQIVDDSTTNFSQGSSSAATFAPPASESTRGVVPLLATCYLSLGDLFRYANNLEQAEKAYRTASTLSPGYGHAFNQLAVVCQVKEKQGSPLSAVALYWYTRALLVTVDPFVTAKSNLAKLLASNHEWLKKQTDLTDRSKAAQTPRFLSTYVDLHYRFFQGIDAAAVSDLKQQMESVMDSFRSLLEMSAFGDSLLCRLVVIHAFSECYLDRPNGTPSALTMVMARVATYEFGSRLADRVMGGLSKVPQGKLPSSVRLLLPVLLVAEFTASVSMPPTDNAKATEALETATRKFWQGMIAIWNKVTPMMPSDMVTPAPTEELKAFLELRGFGPFGFLPPCHEGYLSDDEALQEVLQANTKKDKTNESASASTSVAGTATDQGRVKFARLLKLADRLLADSEGTVGRFVSKNENGNFVWLDNCQDEEETNGFSMPMDVDVEPREGNNMLVYKTGADGGPALLVPGMMLQQEVVGEVSTTTMPRKSSLSPDNQDQSVASEPLPVFDATPVNLQHMETPLAIPHPTAEPAVSKPTGAPAFSSLAHGGGGVRVPPGLDAGSSGLLPPPPGFAAPATPPTSQQPETIGEALRLYGNQLQTANPFASPATPGLSNAFPYSAPEAPRGPSFLENNDDPMEGTSLLDSSLLNSLWMDDGKPKTKNPFAT